MSNIMNQHRGEIIEVAIRSSGYNLKEVARRLGISRSTLYNKFKRKNISAEFLLKLSSLINYDFSHLIPSLKRLEENGEVAEETKKYEKVDKEKMAALQIKYCRLLENYNELLRLCIQITSREEADLKACKKDILRFFEAHKVK